MRLVPDVLGDGVLDRLVVEGEPLVGGGLVRVDRRTWGGVVDDEALQGFLVGALDHCALTRFVARSFAPTTAVLPTAPRPVSASSARFALLMFLRLPPIYVSSTSTGPENFGPLSLPPPHASRMRCSMNHEVGWLTPMSRWSFMLLTPLRLVSSR